MRRSPTLRWWTLVVVLVAALSILPAVPSSAALPKAGKLYTGFTSAPAYHAFTPPVSFKVSKDGKQLLAFKWAGGGCIGLGGPGNPWANPELNYKVGTINVSSNGTFSVKKVKWTFTRKEGGHTFTRVTISTVNGRFTSATKATGTVSFSQKQNGGSPCSGKVSFTAIMGSAPGALHKKSPASGATGQPSSPTLSWTTSSNASSYAYCIDTSNNDTCNASWVSTSAVSHATLKGLKAGTTYYWQVRAKSAHGTVAADSGFWWAFTVAGGRPQAGSWVAMSLSGPVSGSAGGNSVKVTRIFFTVLPNQATVSGFGFGFEYSGAPKVGQSCSGSSFSGINAEHPSPITNSQFSSPSVTGPWSGSGSGAFHGTFDSSSRAHGTAQFSAFVSGPGCFLSSSPQTGTFSWVASKQP